MKNFFKPKPVNEAKPKSKLVEGKASYNPRVGEWYIVGGMKFVKIYSLHPKSDPEAIIKLRAGCMVQGQIVRGKFKI